MGENNRDAVYIKALGITGIKQVNKEYAYTLVNGVMHLQRVVDGEAVDIHSFEKKDLHFSLFDLIDNILNETDVLAYVSNPEYVNQKLWQDEKAVKLLKEGFLFDRGQRVKEQTKEAYKSNGKKWDKVTSIAYDNEVRYEFNMIDSYIKTLNKVSTDKASKTK